MAAPTSTLSRRRFLGAAPSAVLLAGAGALLHRAAAQGPALPQRAVRLVVPNAPGSSVDTIARLASTQLAEALQQPVIVDNKAGAAGALGVEFGRTAPPDGYTLIVASSSSITVAPLLQKAVRYDPLKDFDFISLVAMLPNVLVCNPALPVRTTAEFIAYARTRDGRFNMASAGVGSVSHLAGVALQSAADFKALHVPYKGGSQGVASVVSGETDWVLTPAPAALGLASAGRLRLLAHSMAPGTHPLGAVPSLGETVDRFEFSSWIGLMAPKGLPPPVVERLRAALAVALQQPSVRDAFTTNGAVAGASTPQEYRAYLVGDIQRTKEAIRLANVQPE